MKRGSAVIAIVHAQRAGVDDERTLFAGWLRMLVRSRLQGHSLTRAQMVSLGRHEEQINWLRISVVPFFQTERERLAARAILATAELLYVDALGKGGGAPA